MLLNLIRKHKRWLFFSILILMLFPFLFWGIGSIGKQEPEKKEPMSIHGKSVSPARLKEAGMDSHIMLLIDFVEGNNIKSSEQFEVYKDWFGKLIDQIDINKIAFQAIILQDEAASYGITTTTDEITNWIGNFPLFQVRGVFNIEKYNAIITNYFHSWPAQFETALNRILTVKKLRRFIMDTVLVSDKEAYNAYKDLNEKVTVRYAEFNTADYLKHEIKIEDSEIKDYYEKHKEDFRKPERIKLSYLLFDPAGYKKEVEIGQKEIEDYYEANKDEFIVEEKKEKQEPKKEEEESSGEAKEKKYKPLEEVSDTIKQKLIDKEAEEVCQGKALDVSIKLTEEKRIGDMINLAKERGLKVNETDYIPRGQIFIPELGQAQDIMQIAWRMETGTISDVLLVNGKWVIISIQEKKPSKIPEFSEVAGKIRDIVKNNKAQNLAKQFGEETLNKLPKNMPFAMAAKSIGLKLKKSKQITKADELFTRATELKQTPKGTVLVSMDKLYPINEKTWEKEKDNFTKTYREQKKRRFFQEWLNKISI